MSARRTSRLVRRTTIAQIVSSLFVGAAALGTAMPAAALNCTWVPATGNWGTAGNWSCGVVPTGGPDTANIALGQTVTINTVQSTLNLNNAGSLNIDAFLLTLAGGGSTANTGTINVGAGPIPNNAALQIGAGHNINNTGGVINVSADSVINQFGSTISGGTINTTGTGALVAFSSGNNILSGVTLNGTLDATNANSRERIANGLTLNGAINIGGSGIVSLDSTITTGGNQTIGGTGTINLNAPGARLALEGPGTTTLGANIVVRGQGNIGQPLIAGGNNTLVNNGRISADVNGATLTIVPGGGSGSVTNNNLIDARNGGTLNISNVNVNNAGGTLNAQTGSVVLHSGGTITGGTLSSAGSGVFRVASSSANILDAVTLAGTMDMTTVANARQRTANGITLSGGAINIANGGILSIDGGLTTNQTIGGTGTINLNDSGARLALENNGSTTIGAGVTVRGQGNIGQPVIAGGTNNLVNNGTLLADGGTLTVVAGGGGGNLTGSGTLQVNGGTLSLATGQASTQGQLQIGATGTLATNNQNLTLNTDYTNAQAGTGNAFNRRAGVTGTGQIRAGGNAAQVITGANVTNGTTTNATLTIGNVRVGTTTFDYQVANTGTTGPTLRGAIQTNVNGANLTDARLGGTGVTPSNYNAGAPGGNSGNLGVSFTAASAGALAPLTGQVLNLRSNFENIPDQKLNIVLGAGAAAYNAAAGSTVTPVVIANQRVNGTGSVVLNITNTAPAGAFSEDLNASFSNVTGGATAGGSLAGRLAGTNNTGTGAINVGVATGSAGAQSGTVQINYQTAGAVNGVLNGLGTASAGSQVVSVSGNVYQAAAGQIQTPAFNFGNLQVGQQVSQNLTIRNTATGANGFVEDLNASFGSSSNAQITGSGSLTGITAGNNSTGANGTMTVTVTGANLGALSGNIAVNYTSAGTVNGSTIAGLGTLGVGSELYGVTGTIITGNVIDTAKPVINGVANPGAVSVNFGNVRIGSSANQNLNVLNQSGPAAQQADLNASIASNGAPVTANGSFTGLQRGQTNNISLNVGIDTSAAGVRSGSATVSLVSDISAFGNCAPNCTVNLPNQTVNVTGTVYNLANPVLNTPTVNLAARVGNASPSQVVSVTNQSVDAFREGLNASISTSATGFTATGSVTNLAAQANSGNALNVALNTATAGTFNGSAVLTLASNGSITNNSDVNLASQNVTLSGKVYTAAAATVQNTVSFGIVHVGESVANRSVSVQNTAPVTALNDTLRAQIGGTSGAFSNNGGSVAGLNAGGAANNTALTVGLNTANAGIFNGSASVALASQNPDMADLGLGSQTVTLNAQVNKYANAVFGKVGAGTLTQNGSQFILDFGTVFQGSGSLSALVDVDNLVGGGPADLLDGSLTVTDGNDFTSLLNAAFFDVAADASSGDLLSFLFNTNTLGSFQDSINLNWAGHNASGYRDQDQLYTLLVRGNVIDNNAQVPEPNSLLLLAIAIAGLGAARRKRS